MYKNAQRTFKERVFCIVKRIPRGKALTYEEVAEIAGNKLACRAVGNILSKNFNEDVPCHRVIKKDGTAGKYNRGQKEKIKILKEEGVKLKN